jgi:hypothetical protein
MRIRRHENHLSGDGRELLRAVNREARTSRSTRAALIRAACQECLLKDRETESGWSGFDSSPAGVAGDVLGPVLN